MISILTIVEVAPPFVLEPVPTAEGLGWWLETNRLHWEAQMGGTARQLPSKRQAEVRHCAVSLVDLLDQDLDADGVPTGTLTEQLAGPPTVEATDENLTITSEVVNTSAIDVDGKSVPIGGAVQFTVAGGDVGRTRITITCNTDATEAQTVVAEVDLIVEA